MNHKRLISLTICWILVAVPGLCVLSFAGNESRTNTEAEQHFEKANELRKAADYDAAIAEYKKVISLSSNSKIAQDAQYWIGQSYFKAGQFDDALSAFQKLLDEYPASTIVPSTKLMMERIQQAKKNNSLYEAIKNGAIEQVELLISKSADVNAEGATGWPLLLTAVDEGHIQVVKLLLEHGAKVDVGNGWYTPLFFAIWNDNKEMVKTLISGGADVNARPKEGDFRPLVYAVWYSHPDIAKILIDAGANVNAEDDNGWTPLRHALQGTRSPLNNRRPTDMVKQFIGTGVKIPAIQNAVLEGDLAKVRQLVESGMDVDTPDKFGWTPTYWALSTGQKEVAEYILSKGADVTAKIDDGRTLLHQASTVGLVKIVKSLIAKGVEVDAKSDSGNTPLQDAAGAGQEAVVKLLIAKGADVNTTSNDGKHPLGDAALNGREDVVKLLLASDANVNLGAKGRGTALHAAAFGGHSTIIDILIANGADVNINAKNGTPLHLAASPLGSNTKAMDNRSAKIVEKLLAHGADVHAKHPRKGSTPLYGAVARGRYKTVELLITAGANVNATDNEGKTILSLAQEAGRTEIVELLRKHGAKE